MAYSEETWEEVRKLYEDGVSCAKIAPIYGMNRSFISEKAKSDGWKKNKPKKEKIQQIRQIQQIQQKRELTQQQAYTKLYNEMLSSTDVMMLRASVSDFLKLCEKMDPDPEPEKEDGGTIDEQLAVEIDPRVKALKQEVLAEIRTKRNANA